MSTKKKQIWLSSPKNYRDNTSGYDKNCTNGYDNGSSPALALGS